MTSPLYTATEKRAAVERELRYRKRVYPRLVQAGSMSAIKMTHELAIFEALLEDYRALERSTELPL